MEKSGINCPECNNSVMYDQEKKVPESPACKQEIVAVHANTGTTSLIEYDPENREWLVYKHPIKNINNGTQLIVRPGQQVLLIEEGGDSHLFEKGQYTMDTANFPWMEKAYKLSDGDTKGTSQSSIYFFNMRMITNDASGKPLGWLVKKTPVVFEHRYDEITRKSHVIFNIGCFGTYVIQITDTRKFFLNLNTVAPGMNINMAADQTYSDAVGALAKAVSLKIISQGGEILANIFKVLEIDVFELDSRRSDVAEKMQEKVNEYLDDFGLKISNMLIECFVTPEDDPGDPGYQYFIKLRELTGKDLLDPVIIREDPTRGENISAGSSIVGEMVGWGMGMAFSQEGASQIRDIMSRSQCPSCGDEQPKKEELWDCVCGQTGLSTRFCPRCGSIRPKKEKIWSCPNCGQKGLTGKCCPECGVKRPGIETIWECPECGQKGLTGKCCPECGTKRPEIETIWECPNCGQKGLTGKCCPECGVKRPEIETIWECPKCGQRELVTDFCTQCGSKRPE